MELEAWREQIQAAIADPRRRQLAHIAILEVAMTIGRALEARGVPQNRVNQTTEAVSEYFKGERGELPSGPEGPPITDLVTETLKRLRREAAFASLFL